MIREVTGPAITSAGNRVARSAAVEPLASVERHDVPLAMLALMRRTSASAASAMGENASNGANAPPGVLARTLSHLPGVPNPRMPNCEPCALRRFGGWAVRNTVTNQPPRTPQPPNPPIVRTAARPARALRRQPAPPARRRGAAG